MPSRTFPGLSLRGGYTQGEGGWGAAMTEDLRKLSAVAQLTVKSRTTTLPGTGTAGDVYIVPSGAGSNANEVAVWDDGAWAYIAPDEGWRGYVQDDNESVVYTGTGWSADTPSGSALVSSLNAQLGGSSWQSPLTATDIVSALDAEFGGTSWSEAPPSDLTDLGDTPGSLGTAGQVLQMNADGTALEFATPAAATTTFLGLTDTPGSFTANTLLKTNAAGDAVEAGLVVPASIGTAGQVLKVNTAEDALEFADESGGGAAISFDNETETSYSLTNDDLGGSVYKEMDNASDITVTVPSGLTGTEPVTFEQVGVGVVIFSAAAGVTINAFDSADRTAGQYATATLIPKGSDVYTLSGNVGSA